jgi:hypothetical protein
MVVSITLCKSPTPVQKWEKIGIETAGVFIEYVDGLGVGTLAAASGPGAIYVGLGATAVTLFALDKCKNWAYEQLGL